MALEPFRISGLR